MCVSFTCITSLPRRLDEEGHFCFSDAQDQLTRIELPEFLVKNQALTGSSLVKNPALMTHEGTFDLDLT